MIRLIGEAKGSAGAFLAFRAPKPGSQLPRAFNVRRDRDLRVYLWRAAGLATRLAHRTSEVARRSHAIAAQANRDGRFGVSPG